MLGSDFARPKVQSNDPQEPRRSQPPNSNRPRNMGPGNNRNPRQTNRRARPSNDPASPTDFDNQNGYAQTGRVPHYQNINPNYNMNPNQYQDQPPNNYSYNRQRQFNNPPMQNYHQPPVRNQQYSYPNQNSYTSPNYGGMQRNEPPFNPPHVQNSYGNQRGQPNQYQFQPAQSVQIAPSPAGVLIDQRVAGVVKWYNFKNGFGFVTRNDTHQDIFVHRSGILNNAPGLDDGEPVEFDVYQDGNRLLAVNVAGPNGSSLRGSKYANTNSGMSNSNMGPNPNEPARVFRRRRAN